MMVTIVLIAIGTTLALPSYKDMVEKRQVSSGAEQVAAFVNQGKSEAARRNRTMTFSYNRIDHENWCVGVVDETRFCDCWEESDLDPEYCGIDGVKRVLSSADVGGGGLMHQIDGNISFAFEPIRGILVNEDDAPLFHMHSDDRSFQLWVMVGDTGEVTVCSKDGDHNVPGYDLCP